MGGIVMNMIVLPVLETGHGLYVAPRDLSVKGFGACPDLMGHSFPATLRR